MRWTCTLIWGHVPVRRVLLFEFAVLPFHIARLQGTPRSGFSGFLDIVIAIVLLS